MQAGMEIPQELLKSRSGREAAEGAKPLAVFSSLEGVSRGQRAVSGRYARPAVPLARDTCR
eukprot:2510403-Prymnesium_polylepis.1